MRFEHVRWTCPEIVSAGHILTDPTLAPVEPVFDHLKEGTP
ncbi:hypothetical protein [Streptomyces sp. NPDC007074]